MRAMRGQRWLVLLRAVLATTIAAAWGLAPAVASADSLGLSLSASTVPVGVPTTLTVATNGTSIDNYGDGPYLYAVVQPTGSGSCLATFGQDQQVDGASSTVLADGQEVAVGTSSSSFSYTQYWAGQSTICAWLETDPYDSADSGDTSSVVTAVGYGTVSAVNTDSLTASLSTGSPAPGVPFTVAFSGNADPTDQYGDGPYLYAVVQPAGSGSCLATYGQDQQVDGASSTVLTGGGNGATALNAGAFSTGDTVSEPAGAYELCAWLETDAYDSATRGDTSAVVLAAIGAVSFSVPNPAPSPAPPAPPVPTPPVLSFGHQQISHAGVVLLPVTCTGDAGCHATAILSVIETHRGRRLVAVTARSRHKNRYTTTKRTVIVGAKHLNIGANEVVSVSLHLNAAGRKLLRIRRRFTAALTVVQGNTVLVTRKVTFKAGHHG